MRKWMLVALMAAVTPAWSAEDVASIKALRQCLQEHTTSEDRQTLAVWVFLVIARHPGIATVAKIDPAVTEEQAKAVGQIFTRLMGEQCIAPLRTVSIERGSNGVGEAFNFLGELAMTELMANPAVTSGLEGPYKYIDLKKLEAAYKDAGNGKP